MSDEQTPEEIETPLRETPRQKIVKFERAPFASEIFNKGNQKKFNELPAHLRQLISKSIEHGNLPLAATEAGIGDRYKSIDFASKSNLSIMDALKEGGITSLSLVASLKQCLDANTGKEDRHGNPVVDLRIKLKALELILKLRSDFGREQVEESDNVLDMFEKKKKDE